VSSYRGRDGFEALVSDTLIDRLCTLSHTAEPNEWIGILIGRVGEDSMGSYVIVDGVVLDTEAIATPGSVRSTVRGEQRVREIAAVAYPGSEVLGWAHSHYRCGTHFSPGDCENQSTWTAPYALGIVCDPRTPERIGVYRGPDAERLTVNRVTSKTPGQSKEPPVRWPFLERRSAALSPEQAPTAFLDQGVSKKSRPRWTALINSIIGIALVFLAWRIGITLPNLDERLESLEHSVRTLNARSVQSSLPSGTLSFLESQSARENESMCLMNPVALNGHESK
jgi:proteasome lid subunit RPN8/RPN11